ncbi:MAG: aldo/keto reductase [Candidatus Heimdallarchaeota archaeon]|nr:aldo/keto reductase [Candidatus Heimdallarchaeota archaeon]MCK4771103.1 aldo/keto reductase [Candidatus Heimdallarchaeota archaeon]
MSELILPKIGLGTWMLKKSAAKFSTIEGIKLGYRHIDTAQGYGNEAYVGEGLQEIFDGGIVKRDEISIATKLHPLRLRPKAVLKSTEVSLKKLKLDVIDILYVHYPAFPLGYSHKKTLGAISKLIDEGRVRQIGVSNFTPNMIDEALKVCDKSIFVNQIEHHPYLQQKQLLEHHSKKGIQVVSYSPLARGHALKDTTIQEIAKRNKISAAQVCLAWVISKGAFPIPKATSLNHLKDNFGAIDIQLPIEDLEKIDEISIIRRFIHPPVVAPKEWKK